MCYITMSVDIFGSTGNHFCSANGLDDGGHSCLWGDLTQVFHVLPSQIVLFSFINIPIPPHASFVLNISDTNTSAVHDSSQGETIARNAHEVGEILDKAWNNEVIQERCNFLDLVFLFNLKEYIWPKFYA